MPTQIQFRRGTTAQTLSFTGATGELTVDTDKKVVVVHDGSTSGGIAMSTENYTNTAFAKANTSYINADSASTYANTAYQKANNTFINTFMFMGA